MADATIRFDGGLRLTIITAKNQVSVALSKEASQVLLEHIRFAVREEPTPNIKKYAMKMSYVSGTERDVLDILKSQRAAAEYAKGGSSPTRSSRSKTGSSVRLRSGGGSIKLIES